MSSHFAKPENALRKAKDLLRVNKESSALRTLQQILTSKRYKTWSLTHEKIMFFYIELAVNLHRPVSDALFQYRSICSTQNIASLEKALKKYRQLSEEKARAAQILADATATTTTITTTDEPKTKEKRKIDQSLLDDDVNTEVDDDPEQDEDLLPAANVDDVEDLEEESPEALMLQAVSGQGSRDRKDRQILAPWVKYLWETYRTILEVLRNNGKLETLYHKTARQAFLFCRRFKRSMEFRRVGEILRNHIQAIQKYTHQVNAVDLNNPETQKLYLETRFQQLKIASEMELWQEAYRTIEDIHDNMRLSRTEPKPEIMKTYYDKLSAIFWASENYLFHAYSLNRFYQLSCADGTLDGEEKKKLATAVLLATLCIPPRDRFGEDSTLYTEQEHEGNLKLANLLGFKKEIPTRTRLIHGLITSGLLEFISYDVKILYELSEIQFGPLTLHTQVKPILEGLEKQSSEVARYVQPIQNLIVLRVIQQLSTVFKSIRLDKFLSLVPSLPIHDIERLVMAAIQIDQVNLRMDHRSQLLHFSEEGMEGPRLRDQISTLARSFQRVADLIEPINAQDKHNERQHVFAAIQQGVDSEHHQVFVRQQEIEKRKQESEREAQERERREVEQKARAAAERKKEEQKRLSDESARREQERKKKDEEQRELAAKERLAAALREKLAKEQINTEKMADKYKILDNVKDVSKQDLIRAQEEILQQQQYETEKRRKDVARRIDYLTRAMRIEEKELLIKQSEIQKVTDREQHEADFKKYLENHRATHDKAILEKQRLSRMGEQRNLFQSKIMQRRKEEYQIRKQKYDERMAKINAERARLERIRDEAAQALEKYNTEKEEEERAQRAEQERLAKQAEDEKALKEQMARDRRAKLEEVAKKQREREAEIEAKEAARRAGGGAARPEAAREDREWKPRDQAPAAAATGIAAAKEAKPEREIDWSKARRERDEPATTTASTGGAGASWSSSRARGDGPSRGDRDAPSSASRDRPSDDKKWSRGAGASAGSDRPRDDRDWGRDKPAADQEAGPSAPGGAGGDDRWRSNRNNPREERGADQRTERPWARRDNDAPQGDDSAAPAREGWRGGAGGRDRPDRSSERSDRSDRPSRDGARDAPRDGAAGAGQERWGRDRRQEDVDSQQRERPERSAGAGDRDRQNWSRDRDSQQQRPERRERTNDERGNNDRRDFRRDDRERDPRDGPSSSEAPRRNQDQEPRAAAGGATEDGFQQVGRRPVARR